MEVDPMSLFSKLLNGAGGDKSPLDMLKNAAETVLNEAEKAAENARKAQQASPSQTAPQYADQGSRSGSGWYDSIPAEENQYNFNGTYLQYFDKLFREEFPGYAIRQEPGRDARSPLFVFYRDGRKRLVVELKSERSNAQAIRRQCEAEGTPYLRFYYDHDGWWNTRSYVRDRVNNALPV